MSLNRYELCNLYRIMYIICYPKIYVFDFDFFFFHEIEKVGSQQFPLVATTDYIDSSSYSNFVISSSFPNMKVNNTYYWETAKINTREN